MKTRHHMLPDGFGARNEVVAPRAGERTAERRCGGVVIAQACDEAAGSAADPVVLAPRGTVPDRRAVLEWSA